MAAAQVQLDALAAEGIPGTAGTYLEIYTLPALFDPDKFELRRNGITIASVTQIAEKLRVVVFVPRAALSAFKVALDKYRYENTAKGKPREAARFERFESFALGDARSLWTEHDDFPVGDAPIWWETWLFSDREANFVEAATQSGAIVRRGSLSYPELVVRLVEATPQQILDIVRSTDAVSELRAAPKTPQVVTNLPLEAQHELITEALERMESVPETAPTVSLLDSGMNESHPLIAPCVPPNGVHAWNASWGTHDETNHGTPMASVALFGDLLDVLAHRAPLRPSARVESVKIVSDAAQEPEPDLLGLVTRDAVSIVEVSRPNDARVFLSAVTMQDEGNDGMPTEWSSAYDALAAEKMCRRLFIVAGGNVDRTNRCLVADYPGANTIRPLYEPAQAYNILTVGGFTDRDDLLAAPFEDHLALAPAGALSPVSRTGTLWSKTSLAPIKPDIVMEAGNYAAPFQAPEAVVMDDYLFLAASATSQGSPLRTFGYTSGAAAAAARHAASIMASHTDFWPETIRGLMVHCAEWTPFMTAEFGAARTKTERALLLRQYGHGVPNLERALNSASNDATMIVQGSLKPFLREAGTVKTNELVAHALPLPSDFLLRLGETTVELKVTLSYFIEPNPGRRGWRGRYSYASHGLRFEVRRATESSEEFMLRVNRLGRNENYEDPGHEDAWYIGPAERNRGSLHSDVWRGPAADLANAGQIVVYPVSGWWRYLTSQQRWNDQARYALLVTLRTQEATVDLYSEIEAIIETQIAVENAIEL